MGASKPTRWLRLGRGLALVLLLALPACQCETKHGDDGGKPDSGHDAGATDAGSDAGSDAGTDGGSDAGADGGTDGGADAGLSFCDQYDRAICDWYAHCGQLDQPQYDDCVALQAWTCSDAQIDSLVDAGKLGFATQAVPSCLGAIRNYSCDAPYPAPLECGALFTPETAQGGSCTRQWSTVCIDSYCQDLGCPSQCAGYLALDAGCTGMFGDECGPTGYCAGGFCTARVANGSPCTANDRCGGGVCDTVQGVCLPGGSQAVDAGCGSDFVCESGLYCKNGNCAPSETDGGPCRIYGGADCAAGYACKISDGGQYGTCGPRSGVDGGCYGLPNECLPNLVCDSPALFAPGTCLAAMSEGQPCVHAIQNCKAGLLCDATTQLCRALPHVGQPCTRDPGNFRSSDCVGGFCPADGGVCLAPQDAGASCVVPWECASTLCTNGTCEALCQL